jgi:hypothetical protein
MVYVPFMINSCQPGWPASGVQTTAGASGFFTTGAAAAGAAI